jgi:nitrogen regulatory protein PII
LGKSREKQHLLPPNAPEATRDASAEPWACLPRKPVFNDLSTNRPDWHGLCLDLVGVTPGASLSSDGEGRMKLVVSVIKPFKLEEVREALTAIGVQGLMVSEVKGYGRQSGHTEIYRGAEYVVNFVPKVKLELVVPDSAVSQVVDTLARTAKTGKIGDGKIFVLDVEQAMRVRTGETGDDAL